MKNLIYCNLDYIKSRLPNEDRIEVLERVLDLVLNHEIRVNIAYMLTLKEFGYEGRL